MKAETMTINYFSLTGMALIKKKKKSKMPLTNAGEDVEKYQNAGEGLEWYSHFRKQVSSLL